MEERADDFVKQHPKNMSQVFKACILGKRKMLLSNSIHRTCPKFSRLVFLEKGICFWSISPPHHDSRVFVQQNRGLYPELWCRVSKLSPHTVHQTSGYQLTESEGVVKNIEVKSMRGRIWSSFSSSRHDVRVRGLARLLQLWLTLCPHF